MCLDLFLELLDLFLDLLTVFDFDLFLECLNLLLEWLSELCHNQFCLRGVHRLGAFQVLKELGIAHAVFTQKEAVLRLHKPCLSDQ